MLRCGAAQILDRDLLHWRIATADLLPEVKDLPEFMQEAEFKRRHGAIGGPEYKKMMAEIGRRVAALAILR